MVHIILHHTFLNADSYGSTGQGFTGYNMFAYCLNNPAIGADPNGHRVDRVLSAWVDGGGGGEAYADGVSLAYACYLNPSVGATFGCPSSLYVAAGTTAVLGTVALVKTAKERNKERTYSVYFLKDSNKVIQYVGRVTDEGFDARMRYHKATKGLELAKRIQGLSYEEARGMEEIGMLVCHTLIPGSKGINNRIHGISIKNRNYDNYMNAAFNYLSNKAEEDFLNFITLQ